MLTLPTSSFDWALNQAERFGDTDIFPLPFEFSAIRHDWGRLVAFLSSEDVLEWVVRPHRECLSPKSAHSFRNSTQLDPLDWLIYTALIYEIGAELESHRLPQEENVVFSYPESTEGGRRVSVLKRQSRPQNKEHPIDATTQPSRSHPNRV